MSDYTHRGWGVTVTGNNNGKAGCTEHAPAYWSVVSPDGQTRFRGSTMQLAAATRAAILKIDQMEGIVDLHGRPILYREYEAVL